MTDEKTAPAIGISLSVAPSDGRSIVFQTHVPQDIPAAEMDAAVDKLYAAGDRLVNRCAAFSLGLVIEKLKDEHEDQCTAAQTEMNELAKLESQFQQLGDARGREADAERRKLAAQINAKKDQLKTHMTNEASYERLLTRQLAKQQVHLDKAK